MSHGKLLALTFSVVFPLFAASAQASWPGREGPIAFVGVEVGQNPYDFEPTGLRAFTPGVPGSEARLTDDPTDRDPQVSPDGRLVVFSRTIEKEPGWHVSALFEIGIDGGGLRQLTEGGPAGGNDVEPAFYPSGRSIVFARWGGSEDLEGLGNLYSIRLDGSNLRQITTGPARERSPAVSPSGRQIAFECSHVHHHGLIDSRRHICSIRPDGTRWKDLTPRLGAGAEASDPDFSPSGRAIAFTVGPGTAADVFKMRADGSRLGALTNRGPHGGRTFPRETGYAQPSFSPAGGSLVAVARTPGVPPHFVRLRLRDPKHPRPLGAGLLGRSPAWAPG